MCAEIRESRGVEEHYELSLGFRGIEVESPNTKTTVPAYRHIDVFLLYL